MRKFISSLGLLLVACVMLFSQSTPTPPYPHTAINQSISGAANVITSSGKGAIKLYGLVATVGGATVLTIQDSCGLTLGTYNLTANGSEVDFPLKDLGANPYFSTGNGCNLQFSSTNNVTFTGTIWFYQQ